MLCVQLLNTAEKGLLKAGTFAKLRVIIALFVVIFVLCAFYCIFSIDAIHCISFSLSATVFLK